LDRCILVLLALDRPIAKITDVAEPAPAEAYGRQTARDVDNLVIQQVGRAEN